jgi:hypothetical protein
MRGDRQPAGSPPPVSRVNPTVEPAHLPKPEAELTFDAARKQTRHLEIGRAAAVQVTVDEPGLVEIPGLGLSAAAEPVTPASFEVLPTEVRRFAIFFTPAAGDEARPAGTLVVTPAAE